MNILVLGWEYPPVYSGGLGVATKNLAEALAQQGINLCFALPSFVLDRVKEHTANEPYEMINYESKGHIEIARIPSSIASPYATPEEYLRQIVSGNSSTTGKNASAGIYGQNLFEEIERYAHEVLHAVKDQHFDLVHAHDWITFPAGGMVKKNLDIPLITHVHSTEYDRTGDNPDSYIKNIEKTGLQLSNKVIAVSNYTKNILSRHYGIEHSKIRVVHNGVEKQKNESRHHRSSRQVGKNRKTVLFLGRLTIQKGPDWFLKIAKRILSVRQDVDFLIGGTGHMLPDLLSETLSSGLRSHIHFLGFLNEHEREKAFANADAYVLSSVSEPFGLSAVEASQREVPVVLCKQSGVREVISHALLADFWDVDKMANNILAILEYPALQKMLATKATHELVNLTWENQAGKVHEIYKELVA
ncbi:MAG: glycosyltransferase family 4 protein [bacterium]